MGESEVAQSCPTLCDPVDYSPPGSSVHGILQARILEWVAISFSRGLSDPGVEPRSPVLQADALTSEPPGPINNVVIVLGEQRIDLAIHVHVHVSILPQAPLPFTVLFVLEPPIFPFSELLLL